MIKINKYILKATIQTVTTVIGIIAISAVISLGLNYINPTPTQLVGALITVFLIYALYSLITIQAKILESRDKINARIDRVTK